MGGRERLCHLKSNEKIRIGLTSRWIRSPLRLVFQSPAPGKNSGRIQIGVDSRISTGPQFLPFRLVSRSNHPPRHSFQAPTRRYGPDQLGVRLNLQMKYWIYLLGLLILYEGSLAIINRHHQSHLSIITPRISDLNRDQEKIKPFMYSSTLSKSEFDDLIIQKKMNDAEIEKLSKEETNDVSWINWTATYSITIRFILPQFGIDWDLRESLFRVSA